MSDPTALVQKLWNYCNILRDDGLSYGDYVERLTFRLFLKMADEQGGAACNKAVSIPKSTDRPVLLGRAARRLVVAEELVTLVSANVQRATQLRQSIFQRASSATGLTESHVKHSFTAWLKRFPRLATRRG